jgi:hypothetical protein
MMRPDFSEVESAAEILIAAQDGDWGPIQHQGLLHDRASYRYYWELLARAQATGMTLPSEAQALLRLKKHMDLPALTQSPGVSRPEELGAVPQPAQPDRFAESRSQRTARADAMEERRRHGGPGRQR